MPWIIQINLRGNDYEHFWRQRSSSRGKRYIYIYSHIDKYLLLKFLAPKTFTILSPLLPEILITTIKYYLGKRCESLKILGVLYYYKLNMQIVNIKI